MNGEKISRCLDAVPESMLEEAMKPYKPHSFGRHLVKIAACLALVVAVFAMLPKVWEQEPQLDLPTFGVSGEQTLPTDQVLETKPQKFFAASGILKVYGSSKVDATEEELKQYEMTDGIGSYGEVITIGGGQKKGISLLFRFPEDYFGEAKIRFVVSADYGFVWEKEFQGLDCIEVENGSLVWWRHGRLKEVEESREGRFYANVIIYADDKAVGYGVIDFCFAIDNFNMPIFWTTAFTTVCYPLVNGEYQDVTEEYLWEQIAEYKKMKYEEGEKILMN